MKHNLLYFAWIGSTSLIALASPALAQTRNIDIPAEDLNKALDDYIHQFGVQLVYNVGDVTGLRSHAVHGMQTPVEALAGLLEGTGVVATRDSTGAVVVSKLPVDPVHRVKAALPAEQSKTEGTQARAEKPEVPPTWLEQVVVTGTNIHGGAPVGSNLIVINEDGIRASGAVSTYEIAKSIPVISAMQQSGQGKDPNEDFQPNIHDLGGSASNATLVLIDGHRFELSGTNHPVADPSVIPPVAIERVEVLPDGASSVYGSDAVAGVINFITRTSFDGLELNAQNGYGGGFSRYNADLLWGRQFGSASAIFAMSYSDQGGVPAKDRNYGHGDHTALGGTNFSAFNCDPATIQPAGQNQVYLSSTSSIGVVNSAANAPCDNGIYSDLVPPEKRASVLAKVTDQINRNLVLTAEFVYGNRTDNALESRGTVTATVFQTGPQANPFYVNPPGVTATSQTIRWDPNAFLGPGAEILDGDENGYADLQAKYQLGNGWRITALGLFGKDHSWHNNENLLCVSCAYLALNGTTSGNGNLTTPSIPNTTDVITALPLTTANALDVWNPAASNQTSATTRSNLIQQNTTSDFYSSMHQLKLGADGPLLDLPAGAIKLAVGGEVQGWDLNEQQLLSQGTGPTNLGGAALKQFHFQRVVVSAFQELEIPLISPEMSVPFVRRLDADLSGRFDSYSDVGSTFNPKFGIGWEVLDGIRLRYDVSSSFVAPSMDILGNQYGNHAGSIVTPSAVQFSVPVSAYPAVTLLGIPGCTAASMSCTIPASIQGLQVANGNRNIKPEKGSGWNFGVDLAPNFLPDFDLSVTLFNNRFNGANVAPALSLITISPPLQHNLVFFPGGATAAQIAALTAHVPIGGAFPATINYIYQFQQQNVLNLGVQGLDISAQYEYRTKDWGIFKAGDALTEFLKYTEQNAAGTPVFSVLNTNGLNNAFPSVQTQMRANVGWSYGNLDADLFLNYTGSYHNWSTNTVSPIIYGADGAPTGGGDKVGAFATLDIHLAYNFEHGILRDSEIYIEGRNVASTPPPFYNSAVGYDVREANPFGRALSMGVRVKL
jgi:iron complex outermembrane receptor protein